MAVAVKVCGLMEAARMADAVALGAAYIGFIFYPLSARCLRPDLARELAAAVEPPVQTVGVFVDPTDAQLETVLGNVPLDILQLHGRESPARVEAIGLATGCRVMKAIRVETAEDVATADAYLGAADMLLFDARPPRIEGAIPGGNGLTFDWRLLAGRRFPLPWALAGGLDAENLASACRLVQPPIVDVSSGVELRPGVKDPAKLRAFMAAAALVPDQAHLEPHFG